MLGGGEVIAHALVGGTGIGTGDGVGSEVSCDVVNRGVTVVCSGVTVVSGGVTVICEGGKVPGGSSRLRVNKP